MKDESDSDEDESDAWQQLVKLTNLTDAYTKCMLLAYNTSAAYSLYSLVI